jgi:hypothetical protein
MSERKTLEFRAYQEDGQLRTDLDFDGFSNLEVIGILYSQCQYYMQLQTLNGKSEGVTE